MKKIKIGQIGIGHNHASALMSAVRKFPHLFEVVGYAEEQEEWISLRGNQPAYQGLKRLTVEEVIKQSDAVLVESEVPNLTAYAKRCVDAGKHIVGFDGEKVKTARGVNSLKTLTGDKGASFQKIKIVDAMDMITDDIRMTAEDNYLGKYANSYDNKCLLISAIGSYFDQLIADGVLESASVAIDVEANRNYLKGKGVNVEAMSDDDIKKANTGSYVYLKATIKILDAIEDIVLPITI